MTISMTKGAVYALYPLTFSRRYQGAPTETIVTTTVENCNDEYGAVAPTCGWATLNGVNVLCAGDCSRGEGEEGGVV